MIQLGYNHISQTHSAFILLNGTIHRCFDIGDAKWEQNYRIAILTCYTFTLNELSAVDVVIFGAANSHISNAHSTA